MDYKLKIEKLEALVQQAEESRQILHQKFLDHCAENQQKNQRVLPFLEELNLFRSEFRRRGFQGARPAAFFAFIDQLVQKLQSNNEFLKIELYETRCTWGTLWRKTKWRSEVVDQASSQSFVGVDRPSVFSRALTAEGALAEVREELRSVTELKNKLQTQLAAVQSSAEVYKSSREHLFAQLQKEKRNNIALDQTNMELLNRLALYDRPDIDVEKEIQRVLQESDDLKKTEGENSDALKILEKRLSQLLALQNSASRHTDTVPGSTSHKKSSTPQPQKPVKRRRKNE